MKKMYSFVLLLLIVGQTAFAQSKIDGIVKNHFSDKSTTAKSSDSDLDFTEWKVTDIVPSLNPAIEHVYVQQYYKGIPVQFGTYKLTIKDGQQVTWEIDQFSKDIQSKVIANKSSMTAESAIMKVVAAKGLKTPQLSGVSKKSDGAYVFAKEATTLEPIKAQQVYLEQDGELKLTWLVSIYPDSGDHWWNVNVDASTGKIIHTEDWVISCNFGTPDHSNHNHGSILETKEEVTVPTEATAALAPDSYNVYPFPIESPIHGNRSIVTDPADAVASPFGWHDTNGSAGAEFTITRGNNVWAQDDSNGNNGTGFSPDGGSGLDFDFPVNLSQQPSSYLSASITNLFYWNNIVHDVFYQYGFDEASGNFQENNYGRGGAGSDSVNADCQDGSGTNNANFSTPADGGNPRMQMFLWNLTSPGRDGSFDNVIIAHEYGHGISIRLVGGPGSNVLGGSEQMGEGWSDWFGLMLTMKAGDQGTDGRGVGAYALGQATDGNGIRPTRYSTDRSINNTDYADIGGLARPHGVGYAFATILWDMTWALIDAEGFDPDFYNGTGGNNIAMALVIEGLKNTANNPGFVSGRDGILQADQDLYGGQYSCIIWKAFAERGVGEGANENNNGGSNGQTDQTVSFVNPCDGGGGGGSEECSGDVASFPYSESFEGSIGLWSQSSDDDLNFTVNSGGTPSSGTGPSAATDGNSYIYLEVSGNGTGYPSKVGILNSPCLDLSSLTNPELSFDYHMIGSAVGNLSVEARTGNEGNWVSVLSLTGAQGTDWNAANIDLANYAGNSSVQLRINATSGSSWQGDIAIDNLTIANASGGGGGDCAALNFNDFNIGSFSTQDASGTFAITGGGSGLSLTNNTWKTIPFNYTVTSSTVIEFDFSSTAQGEIHAIGFEDDNSLSSARYFKVHGTQNYGVTNYDDYAGGTKTYVIPVGSFYTGAMNQLVFINDNDTGSGNTSIFSNVKIYEGSCGSSFTAVTDFGPVTAVLGTEDEFSSDAFSLKIAPNPVKGDGQLQILMSGVKSTEIKPYQIINILGQQVAKGQLQGSSILDVSNLGSGMYLLRVENTTQRFIIE